MEYCFGELGSPSWLSQREVPGILRIVSYPLKTMVHIHQKAYLARATRASLWAPTCCLCSENVKSIQPTGLLHGERSPHSRQASAASMHDLLKLPGFIADLFVFDTVQFRSSLRLSRRCQMSSCIGSEGKGIIRHVCTRHILSMILKSNIPCFRKGSRKMKYSQQRLRALPITS